MNLTPTRGFTEFTSLTLPLHAGYLSFIIQRVQITPFPKERVEHIHIYMYMYMYMSAPLFPWNK